MQTSQAHVWWVKGSTKATPWFKTWIGILCAILGVDIAVIEVCCQMFQITARAVNGQTQATVQLAAISYTGPDIRTEHVQKMQSYCRFRSARGVFAWRNRSHLHHQM